MKYKIALAAALLLAGSLSAQNRMAEPPVSALPIWEQDLYGDITGLPFLQAESAVVALKQGGVKSYSRTGNWLWTYDAGAELVPHVSRSREGTTYVCTTEGTVIAINRVGRELWRIELGSPITAPVITGWDGRLYILAGNRIYCRTASGYSLWMVHLESPVFVKPVLDHRGGLAMALENSDFVLISHLGRIDRLRLDDRPLHTVSLESTAGKDSFYLFYANGKIDHVYRDMNLNLAAESLTPLSQTPVAATGWKENAAVTLRDGTVQLLSVPDARVLWTGNTHEAAVERGQGNLDPYWASMQFDERGVYSLSTRGVTAFRASDGRRLWLLRINGSAAIPVFSDEGYLYSGGSDRILHAYRIEERKRNLPQSLYGPAPEGSYGLGSPLPSSWSSTGESRYIPATIRARHDAIETAIKQGQIGENEPEYVAYLMETAATSLSPQASGVRPLIQIEDRAECVRLLGYLGSRETIPFLAKLFVEDREPIIKSSCAEAIGRIGVDPEGNALKAFTFLLAPENANLDLSILMSAATATKNLCRFSGPPLSPAGIQLLQRFSGYPDFPPRVKEHAARELNTLR